MHLLPLVRSARTFVWRRTVATWSPLASAFNSTQPQLKSSYSDTHGLFGIPELQSHDGFNTLLVRTKFCRSISFPSAMSAIYMLDVQTLRTQDTSVPRHFGPTEVRTQDTSAWPKCPDTSALVPKCLTDTSALDSLSTYIEDQSHCILCKGLPVNCRE